MYLPQWWKANCRANNGYFFADYHLSCSHKYTVDHKCWLPYIDTSYCYKHTI